MLCSSWLLTCPAQIYSSLRAASRVIWNQVQLSKKICIYRIKWRVAPEVMPHCAQKLFYIRVTCVIRNSCVSLAGLRDVLGMFWTPHHTAACPIVATYDLFAHQSCSWVRHTRCHHSSTGELLRFCLLYLQMLQVNKPGKNMGHHFPASPVLYPAIILTDDPIWRS